MGRPAATAALTLLAALAGCSRNLSDWRPVVLAELKDLPGYENRTGPGGDYLSATGDFNGDRQQDRVALMRDEAAGRLEFIVVLGGDQGIYPVGGIKSADLDNVAVARTPPGVHPLACPRENGFPVPCEPKLVTFEKDGINIFGFNSTGTYMYFVGGGFRALGESERPTL